MQKLLKMLSAGSYMYGWLTRAGSDKVITLEEIIELVGGLLAILELPVRIQLPNNLTSITQALQQMPGVEVDRSVTNG